jgi:hypothetical protein
MADIEINRRFFLKNASVGLLYSNFNSNFSDLIWKNTNSKNEIKNLPLKENEIHFMRDKITLNQNLVNYLEKNINQKIDTIVLVAREIALIEDIFINYFNLTIISDSVLGNSKTITIRTPQRKSNEFGQNGYDGKLITFYIKNGTNLNINNNGSDGIVGVKGEHGQFPPDAPGIQKGTEGKDGLKGGNGGNGGDVILNAVVLSKFQIEQLNLNEGNFGLGGDGGFGGIIQRCKAYPADPSECPDIPPKSEKPCMKVSCELIETLKSGSKGENGKSGVRGNLIINEFDENQWFTNVSSVSTDWSDYRTSVGEFYFRSANNPELISKIGSSTEIIKLALSELNAAIKLNPKNNKANQLYQRVVLLHTPLGISRFIDVIPNFKLYEENFTNYFLFVKDQKDNATTYKTLESFKNGFTQVLEAQRKTVVATRSNIQIKLNSVLEQIKRKNIQLEERIKALKEIERRIKKRQEDLQGSDFDSMVKNVKVVIAIGSAIYTGGASLIASIQDVVQIADTATSLFGTLKALDSLSEASSAFGEMIDVSNGKKKVEETSNQKLNKDAKDFGGAVKSFDENTKKFNESKGILLNIEKTISDIKGINVEDKELKGLFEEQANNLREILNIKKDLELLSYDKQVAEQQIEVLIATENEISINVNDNLSDSKILRLNFLKMVKRSQLHMDFIMNQIFYSVRSLEILQFINYSNLIRYDFGYFHPDLERDLLEFNDEKSANTLFDEYNNTWSDAAKVTDIRAIYDTFVTFGNWTTYTLRITLDKKSIEKFINNPKTEKIYFSIGTENTDLSNKKYAIIQDVKLSLQGAKIKSGNSQINVNLFQSGSISQRTDDLSIKSSVLEEISFGIPDVQTKGLTGNVFASSSTGFGFNPDFKLSYRPIYGHYEINIDANELTKINLSDTKKVQIWFKLAHRN